MFLVQIIVASQMSIEAFGVFYTHIMIINLSLIPAPGIQLAFAYEAASRQGTAWSRRLAGRAVGLALIFALAWSVLIACLYTGRDWVAGILRLEVDRTLLITLSVALLCLWLPILYGILQGRERFGWLGWAILGNGGGRLAAMVVVLWVVGPHLAWLISGALAGALLACGVAGAPLLFLLGGGLGRLNLWRWYPKAALLAMGPGMVYFMMIVDIFVARARFDESTYGCYSAAGMVGRGLLMFVGPLAAVMFPRLVGGRSDKGLVDKVALASLGVVAVVVVGSLILCQAFVLLPVEEWLSPQAGQWLAERRDSLSSIASMTPPFMVVMGLLALSNVYISHLSAGRQFSRLAWLLVVSLAYALGLACFDFSVEGLLWWMGISNAALLALSWLHSRRAPPLERPQADR